MSHENVSTKIGLSLSGGGIRAAVFHLGVLRRLAEERRLENVSVLSTVSGGSLVTAAIFAHSGMRWPTSEAYLSTIYPRLRQIITTTSLLAFDAVGWKGLFRHNTRLLTDRAGLLALFLKERWGVTGSLADLPDTPIWYVNTTCFETGKNWRFSKREMGDWQFGRHYNPQFEIAEAAAASAAVPYGIGALKLNALKLYVLITARRDYETNAAHIGYEKIIEYTGMRRERIKAAISVLLANDLIHVEHFRTNKNPSGVSVGYRLVGVDPFRHMGTSGKSLDLEEGLL